MLFHNRIPQQNNFEKYQFRSYKIYMSQQGSVFYEFFPLNLQVTEEGFSSKAAS